jgi:PIN domain nuclease of toxin-antitoxin system
MAREVILDTCAVLWLTLDPEQLSSKAHKTISQASQLLASSISVWEIGVKALRGRLDLGCSFEEYASRLQQSLEIEIVPVDSDNWIRAVLLHWEHRDPADRVIVALAQRLSGTIVTDDKTIRSYYKQVSF